MSLRGLLDNQEFWRIQEHEFEAIVLDLTRPDVTFGSLQFWARLYLQHMRAAIEDINPAPTSPNKKD